MKLFESFGKQQPSREKPFKKKTVLERVEKSLKIFMAMGIVALGADSVFESRLITGYTPDHYIKYCGVEDELQQKDLKSKLTELEKVFSPSFLSGLEETIQKSHINSKEIPTTPKIEGFEKVGIENEKIKKLWSEKYYPTGTINGVLKNVQYQNYSKKSSEVYNISSENGAEVAPTENSIKFLGLKNENYPNSEAFLKTLDWYFSHEIGHINDWMHSSDLKPEERVDFILEVVSAFNKPASFRDLLGYVNSINNQDVCLEKYYKVAEYWAVLCEYYLSFPDLATKRFLPEETNLIKKWLLKGKGDKFDPSDAIAKRGKLIEEICNE